MMSIFLPKPQERLLTALSRFRYLSAFQLKRLLYPNALSYVQGHLSKLFANECVQRIPMPRFAIGGRPLQIYALTAKGMKYLADIGVPSPRYRTDPPSPFTLTHTLIANDMVILAHEFVRANPSYQISSYLTEYELKQRPADGVSPDGCVMLENGVEEYPLVFEVDRGTEERTAFKRKIEALARYSQSGYKAHVASEYLTIAFVSVAGSPNRLESMLTWTGEQLSQLGIPELGEMFLFASFEPASSSPERVFNTRIWRTTLAKQTQSLLSG